MGTVKIHQSAKINENSMKLTLDKAEPGQKLLINHLPDGDYKLQLIRLGILEGEKVECLNRTVGGTIILKKNRLELALGNDLAKKIIVTTVN